MNKRKLWVQVQLTVQCLTPWLQHQPNLLLNMFIMNLYGNEDTPWNCYQETKSLKSWPVFKLIKPYNKRDSCSSSTFSSEATSYLFYICASYGHSTTNKNTVSTQTV